MELVAAYDRNEGMDPDLFVALIERLPDSSMTAASAAGGRHMFGWGQDRYLLADLYDALNLNTIATGQWKKKPPNIKPFPRPRAKLTQTRKTGTKSMPRQVSLKDLHAQLMGAASKRPD